MPCCRLFVIVPRLLSAVSALFLLASCQVALGQGLYVERHAQWTASSSGGWETVDLSGGSYLVPADAVVEIAVRNSNSGADRSGGVRAVGSSLERRFQLHEAEDGGSDVVTLHVQTDGSSEIECYAENNSDVRFYLLGYWTTGTYVESFQSLASSSNSAWNDQNLSSYGVGPGQVAEVVMANTKTNSEQEAGVRTKGSTLERRFDLHEPEGDGVDVVPLFVQAEFSAGATIQLFAENKNFVEFTMVGYWTSPPGKFTEAFDNIGVPSATSTWRDKSLSSYGVPADAVVEMVLGNQEANSENDLGVRTDGSALERRFDLQEAEAGGGDFTRMHVAADSSSSIELYSSDTSSSNMDALLTGYCETVPNIGTLLLAATSDSSPTSQESARKALFESWGYTVVLIDDADTQANFDTALAAVDVVYVSEEVDATSLGTKLQGAQIGLVNEKAALVDEFGFASTATSGSHSDLSVVNGTHYVTRTFGLGTLTIFSSAQSTTSLSGTVSPDVQSLGTLSAASALAALESGAKTHDGSTTSGRRVQLPWGGDTFDVFTLSDDGKTLLQRALRWASGLVGYWKLDETTGTTAADSSGYGHDGTANNSLAFDNDSISPAKVGDGLELDGADDYVSVANSTRLQITDELSISAWIMADAYSSGTDVDVILRKGDGNPNNFQLAIADGKVTLYLDESDSGGAQGDTVLQPGVWYHVAATWDGTDVRIYVKGKLDNGTPDLVSAPIGTDTRSLYLGGTPTSDHFDGALDEVRLYNYALSVDEIDAVSGLGQAQGVRVLKWVEVK